MKRKILDLLKPPYECGIFYDNDNDAYGLKVGFKGANSEAKIIKIKDWVELALNERYMKDMRRYR